jgi:hypothetical protein
MSRWWVVAALAAGFALGAWWYYQHTHCQTCQQRSAELAARWRELRRRWALRWLE